MSSRKRFFFVRHGETDGNAHNTYQFHETALSEKGKRQAEFLAHRFGSIPIDHLVASDMVRARETAEAISTVTGCALQLSPLLREVIRPSVVWGKSIEDPVAAAIIGQVRAKFVNGENWHHSDEENFFDLRSRAVAALEFLSGLQGSRIAVATHGVILRMMVAVMLRGQAVEPKECVQLQHFLSTSNTGISICDYDGERIDHWLGTLAQWKIVTWNDHTHLGQVKP